MNNNQKLIIAIIAVIVLYFILNGHVPVSGTQSLVSLAGPSPSHVGSVITSGGMP